MFAQAIKVAIRASVVAIWENKLAIRANKLANRAKIPAIRAFKMVLQRMPTAKPTKINQLRIRLRCKSLR